VVKVAFNFNQPIGLNLAGLLGVSQRRIQKAWLGWGVGSTGGGGLGPGKNNEIFACNSMFW